MAMFDPSRFSRSEVAAITAIRARGQTTRSEVAADLGISVAMAARLVARLQQDDVLREVGRAEGHGPGRQSHTIALVPDIAWVVGVAICSETIDVLVANAQATPHCVQQFPADRLEGLSQPAIVAALAGMMMSVVTAAHLPFSSVAAVGVAIAGIIDSERGICLTRSTTPGWEMFPIAAGLRAALGVPVLVEEIARAKSVAELALGAGRGTAHFLYVDAGATIGSSLVIGGRPFRGAQGLAGELGHVTVNPTGPLCRCGNRGCVQASASATALVARARDQLRSGVYSSLTGREQTLTFADLARAGREGDKMALGLLTTAGEQLGEALSMALNLLGVDLVVLGGSLIDSGPVLLAAAERIVHLRVLPVVRHTRTLIPATVGGNAAALGVVVQALDALFSGLPASVEGSAPATAALRPPHMLRPAVVNRPYQEEVVG